jgi:8-oxo-dGTP pyrophosphatase MutT (NUDIX family)
VTDDLPAPTDPVTAISALNVPRSFFGEQGAGCIPLARSTGRILLLRRSSLVDEPGTWGNAGGAHHADEAPADAARRELREETGYGGPIELVPARAFQCGSFVYSNFIGLIDEEFVPELNWEADDYRWCAYFDLPRPLHFGLRALFGDAPPWTAEFIDDLYREVAGSRCKVRASPALSRWLAGTQIVDSGGEPLVAYHGSAHTFDRFDISKAGTGRGSADEAALFFSLDPWTATHCALIGALNSAGDVPLDNGGVVYPVFLRAERPCVSPLHKYIPDVNGRASQGGAGGAVRRRDFPEHPTSRRGRNHRCVQPGSGALGV